MALEFVDTHIHFNDFKLKPTLRWSWLEPDFIHPVIGNIDGIKAERYVASEFEAESRFSSVTKTVHVQAALGTKDPVRETRWLSTMADESGLPTAIVADARLQEKDVGRTLERHSEFPRVRGIRDFGEGDYLTDPHFERGYALLARFGFVYDLDCRWETMPHARRLAERHPDTIMVLEHAGFPERRDLDYFENWKAAIEDLAEASNVYVKISGLGMADQRWTVDSLRPWVDHCVEAFGTERSFFGTNWPVDRLFSSYPDLIGAYKLLISSYSDAEQRALFSANAELVYGI